MSKMIYADFNASTPPLPKVLDYVTNRLNTQDFGNPNSNHFIGQKLIKRIEHTRSLCAEFLDATPEQIIFTSGASESISTIFQNIHQYQNLNVHYFDQEHDAVLTQISSLKNVNIKTFKIQSDDKGRIDLEKLDQSINRCGSDKLNCIVIMSSNNETGIIQPLDIICEKYSKRCLIFSDATQSIGKTYFNFNKLNLDYSCASGHKFGALPGSGLLLIKDPKKLSPLIKGADQEYGLRSGTQNYLAIESIAIALSENNKYLSTIRDQNLLREDFENSLIANIPEITIIGKSAERIVGTSLIAIKGLWGEAIQLELESIGIMVSTSSACGDKDIYPSHVLSSLKLPNEIARSTIRISFGLHASKEKYQQILNALMVVYKRLKHISAY